ncbi:hypothetical protein ABT256_05490 [Amycolatopsis japonica]|uniref:hypothetical protein n=1 Tax=Amycolatopsis japonica TaxID=208439 RepID=UPI0033181707
MSIDDDRERLLQAPRNDLARARDNPATWTGLAFAAAHDDAGRVFDRNRAARFRVLWALQYDRRDRDLPLLRFLLEQQIAYYRDAVPWGLAPDLTLAGFLLTEHRQVEDVWLHWQAKNISFDTALGYKLFHLLTSGVAATVDAVRASSHSDRDRLLREIDSAPYTDAAVEAWLAQQRLRFPADPGDESLKTWANHAARLGEREVSRRFILSWAEGQPRSESTLNTLQFHLAHLGYLPEAVAVQKEAIAISSSSWAGAEASKLLTLVSLEQQAGDFDGALHALREAERALPGDKNGFYEGIWRHFVKWCFLLVPSAPDEPTARRLFATSHAHLEGIPRLWMDGVLDAAITAAQHLRDADSVRRYEAMQQVARHERDEEIRQAE